MKYLYKTLFFVAAITCFIGQGYAEEGGRNVSLPDTNTFAVDRPLTYDNGEPVAVIDTGVISNSYGNIARGPHTFTFTLDENSPFPVVIRGERVQPGEEFIFVENLSHVESRLRLPIYPAIAGVTGKAVFTLELPEIFINACPAGYTEDIEDCFKVTYEELVYVCPLDNTSYRENTKDCRGIIEEPSIPYCDEPYELENSLCVHEYSEPAIAKCPTGAGWTRNGDVCELYMEMEPEKICSPGFSLVNNECVGSKPFNDCPDGSVQIDSACYELKPKVKFCNEGEELFGNQCVETKYSPIKCEVGESVVDGRCQGEIEYNYEKVECEGGKLIYGRCFTQWVDVCSSGMKPILGKSGYHCIVSNFLPLATGANCSNVTYPNVTYPNDWTNEVLHNGKSFHYEFNYTSSAKICGAESWVPATKGNCPVGSYYHLGKCYTEEKEPTKTCPSGTFDSGSSCIGIGDTGPACNYPRESFDGVNQCVETISSPPSEMCEIGTEPYGDIQEQCINLEPSQFELCDGNWEINEEQQVCNIYEDFTLNCKDDYTISNGNCEKITTVDAALTCPTDPRYTLNDDNCAFYEAEAYKTMCIRDGAELVDDGALCRTALQTEAIPDCPSEEGVPVVTQNRCVIEHRVPFLNGQ